MIRQITCISILLITLLVSCSQGPVSMNILVEKKTMEMLKGYRGEYGLKLAIIKADDIDTNSEIVEMEIMNAVYQAVFNFRRFVIMDSELLKNAISRLPLHEPGNTETDMISSIGKLTGTQAILIVHQNRNLIDMRIVSPDTGGILAYISFPKDGNETAVETAAPSDYETIKRKYLDMECPGLTRQKKDLLIASFNSKPEDQRIQYIMSMILSCRNKIEETKSGADKKEKARTLNLDKKTTEELESMFIGNDSSTYPSKAARKLVLSQYKKSLLTNNTKQNPSMIKYYRELYNEELIKLILSD